MGLKVYSLAHKADVTVTAFIDPKMVTYGKVHPTTKKYKVGSGAPAAYENHNGVDTCLKDGSPIYAVCDGYVKVAKRDPTAGNNVSMHTEIDGYEAHFRYMHLKCLPVVKKGQTIKAGTLLGYQGNTGASKGSHLHFGVTVVVNGKNKLADPFPYLTGEAFKKKEAKIVTGKTGLHETTVALNVREEPDVNSKRVGVLKKGEVIAVSEVCVDSDFGVWGNIGKGWVCLKTLDADHAKRIGDATSTADDTLAKVREHINAINSVLS